MIKQKRSNQKALFPMNSQKIQLLVFFFWGIQILGYSQLNYFLPESNAYFSVSSYKFWFNGDTIIGDYQYKNVYLQIGDSIANFHKAQYYASVREDTIGEKIFCIQKNDGVERLLADFSVKANDTVTVDSFWPTIYDPIEVKMIVQSVDSFMIQNNYHKQISFEHEWPSSEDIHERWIEGIGSTYGLFFPGSIMHSLEIDYPRLLCIYIDDILYYKNDYYPSCYWDFQTNSDQIQSYNFEVFPTIVYDKIYLKGNITFSHYNYRIIDIMGKVVKHGILENCINISHISSGQYFLVIYMNTKKIHENMFIKNRS